MWKHSLFALALLGAGCSVAHAEKSAPQDSVWVETKNARPESVRRERMMGGILVAKSAADLGFKTGGIIDALPVREGDRVRKGQLLARLDDAEVRAGRLQAAESARKAERDVGRLQNLQRDGVVPKADLDDATTGLAVARASLAQVSHTANKMVLVAPDDGWVVKRYGELGEVAAPGRPVLRFESRTEGKVVRIGVTATEALSLKVGAPCTVAFDTDLSRRHDASIVEIARAANPQNGLVEVEVRPQELPTLPDGVSSKVYFADTWTGIHLPASALFEENGDRAAVFVVDAAGTLQKRVVVIAFSDATGVGIASGLDESSEVVRSGGALLREHQRVTIRR